MTDLVEIRHFQIDVLEIQLRGIQLEHIPSVPDPDSDSHIVLEHVAERRADRKGVACGFYAVDHQQTGVIVVVKHITGSTAHHPCTFFNEARLR